MMVKRSLLGIAMILGGLIAFVALLFMAIQVDPASSQEQAESSGGLLAASAGKGSSTTINAPNPAVLYDQTDNPSGNGFPSQEFGAANASYSSQGADDFTVPITQTWTINSVDVLGSLTATTTTYIPSVDVYIYTDTNGLPGTEVFNQLDRVPSFDTGDGSFTIELSPTFALVGGTYWVSIVADMDFGSHGQWFWSNRLVQTGSPYAWRNPDGGFGLGCTDWDYGGSVCGVGGGPDNPDTLYRLNGTTGAPAPEIDIDPESIESEQAPDTQQLATLTISNTGTALLDWTINEDSYPVAYEPPSFDGSSEDSLDLLQYGDSNVSGIADQSNSLAPDAEMFLNQPPNQDNGLFSDVSCDICPGSQSLAENFVLGDTSEIHDIVIWSGYFPTDTPTPDVFTVIFHQDDAGLPGTAIYTQTNVANAREQTGVILFGVNEWKTTLSLDPAVQLGPGNYWVEIFNDTGTGTDDFFWEVGDWDSGHSLAGSVFAFETPGVTWLYDSTVELAIQLIGAEQACDNLEDLPWLSVIPTSGSTPASGYTNVDVTFDSTGLSTGIYTGTLCVESNDTVTPLVRVPVTLTTSFNDTYLPYLNKAPVTAAAPAP